MQVTHGNILSHLYKFDNLKKGLIKLRDKFNDTTVSEIKNKASSIDLSRWEDIISAKVETKVDDLKTNVIPSIGSSISKDFEEMVGMSSIIVSTTEKYAADKETHENIKNQISSLESSISNQSTDTEEGRSRLSSLNEQLTTEKEKLATAWKALEEDLNKVNFLLNAIANIRFIPGGSDGNGNDTGNGDNGDNNNVEPGDNTDEMLKNATELEDGVYVIRNYEINGMTVDVYIDSKTGNRVYVNPQNGKVAVFCKKDDGSLDVWFTDTNNSNYFGGMWDRGDVSKKVSDLLTDHRSKDYALYRPEVRDDSSPIGLKSEDSNYKGLEQTLANINSSGEYDAF